MRPLSSFIPLALAASLLGGCAALQVDVDVYKGPLVNGLDTQVRQYAYLAEASQPLVERMWRESIPLWRAHSKGAGQEPAVADTNTVSSALGTARSSTTKTLGAWSQLDRSKAISDALNQSAAETLRQATTTERRDWLAAAQAQYRCPNGGQEDLVEICNYLVGLLAELNQIQDLTLNLRNDPGLNGQFVEIADLPTYTQLNEAVIRFATQISYVTAQIKLYENDRIGWVDRQTDTLQALGNVLLVHANDINRQLARSRSQAAKASGELRALEAAQPNSPNAKLVPCRPGLKPPDGCDAAIKSQADVIDLLISELRAKRIDALAKGETLTAKRYQQAIDAALAQRASMLYLRPAGDYLRSVHLASGLQDAPDRQFRNMLDDWTNYFFGRGRGDGAQRKAELDKLSWQNINRVTLGGGGATDYVVAKDDVGNWYVKAYGSNPDSIIKAATGLLLFNTGARINTNLLQRQELQSRIDALPDSNTEKGKLIEQRDKQQTANGQPLLALHTRHTEQYAAATQASAEALRETYGTVATQIGAALPAPQADSACALAAPRKWLADQADQRFEQPIATFVELAPKRDPKDLALWETAIRDNLVALKAYGDEAATALARGNVAAGCDDSWHLGAAATARRLVRKRVLQIAQQRQSDLERYEQALTVIMDVAAQK